MRTLVIAFCAVFALASLASAAIPSLWAFNAGGPWAADLSYTVALDPFAFTGAAYPSGSSQTLMDADYLPATSTLYISCGYPGQENWWYQNTIAVYQDGPGGLQFVSSSNADMGNYHWLAGIEYLDGSLYAIAYTDFDGDRVFLKIDNPGTASQTVSQIGPSLGSSADIGIPFALCADGLAGLFAGFGQELYRIDSATGNATLLHYYPPADLNGGLFEGITMTQGRLFGLTTQGDFYEIDLDTYGATHLGDLDNRTWTGLVAIPEPSAFITIAAGITASLIPRKRTS
jgi:hypothetical protein